MRRHGIQAPETPALFGLDPLRMQKRTAEDRRRAGQRGAQASPGRGPRKPVSLSKMSWENA